jgi:predicted negative regulator of RcsB-dependent stress response
MGKLRENWIVLLAAMLINLVGMFAFYSFKNADVKLKETVSKEYVDTGDAVLDTKISKQGEDIDSKLQKKADKETVKEMQSTLKTMDSRIYDLWIRNQDK